MRAMTTEVEDVEADEPADLMVGAPRLTPERLERMEREMAEIKRKRALGLPDGTIPWEEISARTRRVLIEAGVPESAFK